MSIVPLILHDLLNADNGWNRRSPRLIDQHYGLALCPEDLFEPLEVPSLRYNYYRPWRSALAKLDQGSTVTADKDKFHVSLDVQQFAPEEITVKTIDDSIIVEGKHEEKKDEHGYISRQFRRRYVLPPGHDIKNVVSSLSSDGVLTVSAPKMAIEGNPSERNIPIQQTGPVKKTTAVEEKKSKEEKK